MDMEYLLPGTFRDTRGFRKVQSLPFWAFAREGLGCFSLSGPYSEVYFWSKNCMHKKCNTIVCFITAAFRAKRTQRSAAVGEGGKGRGG